jgi:pimeloyl-ACP methyl ester carboxylesterase
MPPLRPPIGAHGVRPLALRPARPNRSRNGDKTMAEIELSAGTIEYEDTGGNGVVPTVVLLHGLAMDGSLWRHVVRELRDDFRCVVPTLPLGGHRRPMHPDADLSPRGIGRLEAEFLARLDLRDVTLVGNDSGLFQFTAGAHPERIARLVITSCEALETSRPACPAGSSGSPPSYPAASTPPSSRCACAPSAVCPSPGAG